MPYFCTTAILLFKSLSQQEESDKEEDNEEEDENEGEEAKKAFRWI